LLALANNGTLFLDEVGELSLELQSMLLRLLESQTYRRVGETEERKVNIRFLFATTATWPRRSRPDVFTRPFFIV
jgi:two-component system NtrC family response regulator